MVMIVRKNTNYGKIVVIAVVIVIAVCFLFMKIINKDSTKDFLKYVESYQNAIEDYAHNDLPTTYSIVYSYDELTSILKSLNYLEDYSDSDVIVSGNRITLSKNNNEISYYNYNNTQTFENRFELEFTKDGKGYICTKSECK